jgi:hypothetical protein
MIGKVGSGQKNVRIYNSGYMTNRYLVYSHGANRNVFTTLLIVSLQEKVIHCTVEVSLQAIKCRFGKETGRLFPIYKPIKPPFYRRNKWGQKREFPGGKKVIK